MRSLLTIFTIFFAAAASLSAQLLPRPQMIPSTTTGNGYQDPQLFSKNHLAMKALSEGYTDNSPKSLNQGIQRSEKNAKRGKTQTFDDHLTYHPGGHDLTKSYDSGKGAATVKDFQFYQKYNAKGFETKKFDSHSFWTGNFWHRSKTAAEASKQMASASKAFGTKTMPVKTAREASMSHDIRQFTTREYAKQGLEQASLNHPGDRDSAEGPHTIDDIDRAAFKPLTVDDVRELLNKMPDKR